MKYGSSHSHVAPRVEFHASKLINDILVQSLHLEAYTVKGAESSVGLTSLNLWHTLHKIFGLIGPITYEKNCFWTLLVDLSFRLWL